MTNYQRKKIINDGLYYNILYKRSPFSNKMRFSLIIPVAPYRNAEILNSVKELDYPKRDFEVLVEKGVGASKIGMRGLKKPKEIS